MDEQPTSEAQEAKQFKIVWANRVDASIVVAEGFRVVHGGAVVFFDADRVAVMALAPGAWASVTPA